MKIDKWNESVTNTTRMKSGYFLSIREGVKLETDEWP